ncbi:hypothetical protein JEHA107958_05050 [Jeotgalicoccus halotolerans]|uniref:Uncharacterized protein n=1 Tax=Jeotgalicoccus halotolerans TaxID=157227 RepID=A0A3E0AXE0_9STAP|nr:hypothetical protein DFR63_1491 [Jeotgalicoccus halotolerans]
MTQLNINLNMDDLTAQIKDCNLDALTKGKHHYLFLMALLYCKNLYTRLWTWLRERRGVCSAMSDNHCGVYNNLPDYTAFY